MRSGQPCQKILYVSCIELKLGTNDEEGITQQIITLCSFVVYFSITEIAQ